MQATEKYSVAWFKLAEYVSRKEKERAFAIYRLLVHSLSNPALAAQLEGDLLYAFNDEKAAEAYSRAIIFYEQNRQYGEAAFVCERVRTLFPTFEISIFNKERAPNGEMPKAAFTSMKEGVV